MTLSLHSGHGHRQRISEKNKDTQGYHNLSHMAHHLVYSLKESSISLNRIAAHHFGSPLHPHIYKLVIWDQGCLPIARGVRVLALPVQIIIESGPGLNREIVHQLNQLKRTTNEARRSQLIGLSRMVSGTTVAPTNKERIIKKCVEVCREDREQGNMYGSLTKSVQKVRAMGFTGSWEINTNANAQEVKHEALAAVCTSSI